MASSDSRSSSFILRIWEEEETDRGVLWRGEIVHIPSGQQQPVTSLREVVGFIAPYLRALGAIPRGTDRVIERLGRTRDAPTP
ncbi:MAG: hypothetical protein HKN04_08795 [Rhodothermaceae bacterium]|nr:hypothetical protein [Rhodothermaceae bacterium]